MTKTMPIILYGYSGGKQEDCSATVNTTIKSVIKAITAVVLFMLLGLACAWSTVSSFPQELVKETSQRMIEALNKNRETLKQNPGKIYALVNDIILPRFDFELMSKWVLGKFWRQVSPEQRTRFTEEFRTLLVRTYAGALLEYSNEEIRYLPMPPVKDTEEVTVHTEFQPKNGPPIPIDYSMRLMNGTWKIYDVSVDGVSLVTNYRGTFTGQIRDGGIEAVINGLKQRNQQGNR